MAALSTTPTSVDEAYYVPNLISNSDSLYYVKSTSASISGATAGVLGLTNTFGFLFYLITSTLIGSVFLLTKDTSGGNGYFPGDRVSAWRTVVLRGLLEHVFPYILFWTLFYALVQIYD